MSETKEKQPHLDKQVRAWQQLLNLSDAIAAACASAAALAKKLAEETEEAAGCD